MCVKSSSGSTPLRIHIERHVHNIKVAGTLAVAEQTAFNAVGTRQQPQFARRNTLAAVVCDCAD